MSSKDKLSIASFAIIFFVLNVDASLKTTLTKQFIANNTHLRVLKDSVANSSIAYLVCNTNCSVALQTLDFDGIKTASCSFEPITIDKFYFDIELQIIPVNKDRVIIGYIRRFENFNDYDYVFVSIRLSDCKITEATISQHSMASDKGGIRNAQAKEFALTKNNDDTYTIVFLDEKMCGSNYCRMILNAEGEVVSGPTAWFKINRYFYMPDQLFSVSTDLSSEKYALVYLASEDGYHTEFSIIESNEIKLRKTANITHGAFGGYSVAHGLFTVCFRILHVGVQCSQYDLAGNVKFNGYNTTLKDTPILAQPYSLLKGGFLLFTIECPKPGESDRVCPDFNSQNYRVSKFDAQGKLIGSLKLQGFRCNTSNEQILKPNYFVNEAGEHCLYLVCTNIGLKKYLNSTFNCFSDEDFKM